MRIAVCSDEPYAVHEVITAEIRRRGHTVVPFGSLATGHDAAWALVAEAAGRAVASGDCDEGVFLCWTGTGTSIAANKVKGVRAALCADPRTAAGARVWNHANVICLSNRTLAPDMAKEILAAWFDTEAGIDGLAGVQQLLEAEERAFQS